MPKTPMHQTDMLHGSAGAGLQPLAKHCMPDMALLKIKIKPTDATAVQHDYSDSQSHPSQPWQGVALLRFQDSQALSCILCCPIQGGSRPEPAPIITLPIPARLTPMLHRRCAYTLRLSGAQKSVAVSGRWTRSPATCTWRTLSKAASLRSHTVPRHTPANFALFGEHICAQQADACCARHAQPDFEVLGALLSIMRPEAGDEWTQTPRSTCSGSLYNTLLV